MSRGYSLICNGETKGCSLLPKRMNWHLPGRENNSFFPSMVKNKNGLLYIWQYERLEKLAGATLWRSSREEFHNPTQYPLHHLIRENRVAVANQTPTPKILLLKIPSLMKPKVLHKMQIWLKLHAGWVWSLSCTHINYRPFESFTTIYRYIHHVLSTWYLMQHTTRSLSSCKGGVIKRI